MSNALHELVRREYEKAADYNARIGLDATVKNNENFFIGKQWEGVTSNGLPTPVFNFLKRVVLFTVASLTSSNTKISASAIGAAGDGDADAVSALNLEFERLFEQNHMGAQIREFLRNSAVDGDGCIYAYWDADAKTGGGARGAIVTEILENTRVHFGNPTDRRVQNQPYIIIETRELLDRARRRAKRYGGNADAIAPDGDASDDKVTVLLKMWKDPDTGAVFASESTLRATIRETWDMGLRNYPLVWLNWDYVRESYHGQAMLTGLIPNQIFVNKLFAMSMISLMTTAYPKIVYDKTRIAKWDNRVGAAIPIAGGDVNSVARIINPAQISPQIAQFIELAIGNTQTFLGATNAALGDVRPDNTSAIIALQKASAVPNEVTRQNLYQCIEDLGNIFLDFMCTHYGTRETTLDGKRKSFDYATLRDVSVTLKLDVGSSNYWSEIASMQTLDNLMRSGHLSLTDYLERVPDGYIPGRRELIEKLTVDN
jgi:hypothetical protein